MPVGATLDWESKFDINPLYSARFFSLSKESMATCTDPVHNYTARMLVRIICFLQSRRVEIDFVHQTAHQDAELWSCLSEESKKSPCKITTHGSTF